MFLVFFPKKGTWTVSDQPKMIKNAETIVFFFLERKHVIVC